MDASVRGDCRVCGRSIALLKDGRIGRHANYARPAARAWPPQMCSGWSQMPKGQ